MVTAAEVGRYLEEVLRRPRKDTVTYTEVAEKFHLGPINGMWSAHPLCQIFDELDQEDARAKRPFRTSVVISKPLNRPGEGFFTALKRYKKDDNSAEKNLRVNAEEKFAVWLAELRKAQEYNWEN